MNISNAALIRCIFFLEDASAWNNVDTVEDFTAETGGGSLGRDAFF